MMNQELVAKLVNQFKGEIDAYCKYKDMLPWLKDDSYLEQAIEEIMHDEYLHAKFIRKYLMSAGLYRPSDHPEYEARFMKMGED